MVAPLIGMLTAAVLLKGSASPTAASTQPVKISPVIASDTLKPGYTIGETRNGGTRELAWDVICGDYRCFAGNGIYDPRWAEINTRAWRLAEPVNSSGRLD